jgi:ankyrin repeat protein
MESFLMSNNLSNTLLEWLELNNYKPDNLDFQGGYGNTALMKASREGREDLVKELIQAGASLERMNIDGNTALWLSCFSNNIICAELLIDAGIKLDNKNVNGVTPLMYTASSGKETFVKLLLDNGADKTLTNDDDFTALEFACTRNIVNLLR